MKKTGMIGLLLLLVCMMAGCQEKKEEERPEYSMYYLALSEERLEQEEWVPTERVTESMVSEIREKLEEPVESDEYLKLLPDEVEILDYSFDGQNVVLNFNEEYKKMKNVREILVRGGIVKAFTQIPGVNGVSFIINGIPLQDSNGYDIGSMNKETFVENEGKNINAYLHADVYLYFANEAGDRLVREKTGFYYSSNVPLEREIVERLIKGPESSGSAQATIAPETKILGVSIMEGVCYVNLDKTFLSQDMNVQEKLPVYSIVNSLMDACRIHGVQISVEGETKVTFRESMSLDQLYQADYALLEEEETDE